MCTFEKVRACPSCNSTDVGVIDSRLDDCYGIIKRRRICRSCNFRYNSVEISEEDFFALLRNTPEEKIDIVRLKRLLGTAIDVLNKKK